MKCHNEIKYFVMLYALIKIYTEKENRSLARPVTTIQQNPVSKIHTTTTTTTKNRNQLRGVLSVKSTSDVGNLLQKIVKVLISKF